jgi:phosphoribosylanthranilate isomerase
MTRVKICGITRADDALLAAQLGASALGFIFWPGSARFISPDAAGEIVAMLPPGIVPVGVFVDQPQSEVEDVARRVRLGAIQLHGNESIGYALGLMKPVIKAVPVTGTFDPASVDAVPRAITVLLDAHDPIKRGGTGRTIDWTLAAHAAARRRVMLSGGLNPENVREAVDAVRPYGVDLSSGVEASPGVKCHERLRALFDALEMRPAERARNT